jgi:hypothetical protein
MFYSVTQSFRNFLRILNRLEVCVFARAVKLESYHIKKSLMEIAFGFTTNVFVPEVFFSFLSDGLTSFFFVDRIVNLFKLIKRKKYVKKPPVFASHSLLIYLSNQDLRGNLTTLTC